MTPTWVQVTVFIIAGLFFVGAIGWIVTRALGAIKMQTDAAKADLDGRKRAIDDLVNPVKASLDEINKELKNFEIDKAAIGANLATMSRAEEQLRKETASLVQALRQPAVRGRWGEMFLDRVVELAGMQEHCTHETQQVFSGPDGAQKPDLVVYLPGGGFLAVDAKAPMSAYLESLDASDEGARIEKLKQHAQQIRNRVAELSRRAYWNLFTRSPAFVVLFIPGEVFLTAAIQQDPELIEAGIKDGVHIAGPMSLISILRAAVLGWREEQLAKNAEEIRRIGLDLYKATSVVAKHLSSMGSAMRNSLDAYDNLVGSMERNLLPKARRLQGLGVAGTEPTIQELEPVQRVPRIPAAQELWPEEGAVTTEADSDLSQTVSTPSPD